MIVITYSLDSVNIVLDCRYKNIVLVIEIISPIQNILSRSLESFSIQTKRNIFLQNHNHEISVGSFDVIWCASRFLYGNSN